MKTIGLITNLSKDPSGAKTQKVLRLAQDLGFEILILPDVYQLIKEGIPRYQNELFSLSHVIVSLGGDGTLLQAARLAALHDKPIMGLNMGNLGFLTDVDFCYSEEALKALKEGRCSLEKRMMLRGEIVGEGISIPPFLAFNDIGIMKALVSRIIHLKASVNSYEINSYLGDGLLVSSPTGSTAYSLSAGGPIVNPNLECLLITPICPHSLNARSIVINSKDTVEIEIMCHNRDITLTADGRAEATLVAGNKVVIKKADTYVKLLRTKDQNFFELLHKKILL